MGVAVDESSDDSETVAQVESSDLSFEMSEGKEVILLRFLRLRRRLRLFCSVPIAGTPISIIYEWEGMSERMK